MKIVRLFWLSILIFTTVQKDNAQVIWQQKANKPTSNMCYGVVFKEKIYISYFTSQDRIAIEEYDPKTDKWTAKKAVSNSKNAGVYCFVSTSKGIYILGGFYNNNTSAKVEEYDPEADTFYTKKDIPLGIDCATASSVYDKIYIIGGVPANSNSMTNSTYEYDPENESWTQKSNCPRMRREGYSISIDNKIYCSGGLAVNGDANYVDVYNPATDTWTAGTVNIVSKWGIGMGYAKNDIYLVAGTFIPNTVNLTSAEIYKYNISTSVVTKVETKKNAIWQMATVSLNDSIYLIGGLKGEFPVGPKQNINEMFTPTEVNSLKNINEADYTIRNNLYSKKIIISGSKLNNSKVSLYNVEGKQLFQKNLGNSNEIEIGTNAFTRGIYIISIISNKEKYTRKIVVN